MSKERYLENGKVIILQPELPVYRVKLFVDLVTRCTREVTVFYGEKEELSDLRTDVCHEHLVRLGGEVVVFPGVFWQKNVSKIKFSKGDLLILSFNIRYLSNWYLLFKAKFKGAKLIFMTHFRSSTSSKMGHFVRLSSLVAANGILFYTRREVEKYNNSDFFYLVKNVYYLNNGLDLTEIKRFRKPYNVNKRPFEILFIGRVTPKARLDLLLNSLLIINVAVEVRVNIVGSGESLDELKILSHRLGISNIINWHGGIIDEEEISKIANRCKLFVYPGHVGLSLIHAFAYGLPAIIHNNEFFHMQEFAAFDEKINGLSFAYNDYHSLAESIRQLILNDNMLSKLSIGAINTVEGDFNLDSMLNRFHEMILSN